MLAATPRWERLLTLAPVFVLGIGLVAAVLILLGRAFLDSLKDVEDKRILVLGGVALVVVVAILTYLGVNLPREG
jgi:hypothetical protein